MKTAVEWLVEQISYTTTRSEIISYHKDISKLVEQAKAMEREQIIKSFDDGYAKCGITHNAQEYYVETFKLKKQSYQDNMKQII